MAGELDGKVAFITGAARGQGRTHAVALSRAGADIIAVDIAGPLPGVPYDSPTPEDLDETARLVEKEGRRVLAERVDVRDLDGLRATVGRGVGEFGRLDVVVANAAICVPATWDQTKPEVFRDSLDINVTGVWNTIMVSAPHLVDGGGGSIIVVSSYAGKKVQPFMVPYTTSKHAVVGMTRAFAAELGRHRVRVNSIHPGAVDTPMGSGDMIAQLTAAGESNPPLMGMGTPFLPDYSTGPEEISKAVVFLASDASSYITAEHLSVDGGAQYF
ncbi:3-ketoacyl-ACP reductase [Mycolicibacterium chitae]|uniref:Short-chain dehydrogenase n=1 Tax=Mycolicibacterium chitae TaxID=1792 RepID=A0A448IB05_MYCCI|nr:mycofactocin-coupled SDR family oxidoreductase [Mycolicibacterium chitae]MCV7108529.1 mycofactocin-coupled SDR family oxidoreductase [Mycolicibacterium chitae]BBZ00761.1 3-ketoacyl-ACP reductase [Mycolicibacterium chitae]VEG49609.1 short-chain dehydrogenase [Mycolicibacterium chitae]